MLNISDNKNQIASAKFNRNPFSIYGDLKAVFMPC